VFLCSSAWDRVKGSRSCHHGIRTVDSTDEDVLRKTISNVEMPSNTTLLSVEGIRSKQ